MYLKAMLAAKAMAMGTSQEDQEESSSMAGLEAQVLAPPPLLRAVLSSSASSPGMVAMFHVVRQLTYVVLLQHLPGVAGVAHVLEVLRGVHPSILYQDLLSPRMLKYSSLTLMFCFVLF